eukprot:COSAG02_NODE_2475_length_8735_cov_5.368110_13_plen_56_part_00
MRGFCKGNVFEIIGSDPRRKTQRCTEPELSLALRASVYQSGIARSRYLIVRLPSN